MPAEGNIVIRHARVNNLKDITVEIPRNRLVVITGVSGSGKSSLAFDTLFAEGQRRFAESLILCPPVPGPYGQTRRGSHRRHPSGHSH